MTSPAVVVYHVQTPYHTLQALGLAATDGATSQLVAVPSHPSQAILLDALGDLPGSPFSAIRRLDAVRGGLERLPPTLARRISAAGNARRLHRSVASLGEAVEVRTANVQTVEGHALAAAAVASAGRVGVIEDGLLTYEKRYLAPAPRDGARAALARWWRQLVFGRWAGTPAGVIPYQELDALWVSFPDAIDPGAWPGVPVRPIPDPAGARPLLEALASAVIGPDQRDAYRRLDTVLVLPHSAMLGGTAAIDALGRLVRGLVESGLVVGVKRHPRDDPATLDRVMPAAVTEIEPWLPVELLFLLPSSSLRWIVTDRTTVVLSGPRYCPAATTITFSNDVPPEARDAYERLMRATGGVLVDSPDGVLSAITSRS
ncbi:hypothetical protein [Rhabdothermincola sp.]|uniref:hypothetical protein n=1 Tax=Rhabdothermincola sp. TaxID=2820405 RepID=UPI002FE002D4